MGKIKTLEVGDVIVFKESSYTPFLRYGQTYPKETIKKKVLGKLGDNYLLSKDDQYDEAGVFYTIHEIRSLDKVKVLSKGAGTIDLTLEDIAELKGVDVDQIKIVEKSED